jgi:hypothetical protein
MRRVLFLLMLVMAVGAVGPAVSASASSGSAEVSGVGRIGQFGDPSVQLGAAEVGSVAAGGFTIAYPDHTFATGWATCVYVNGNTAAFTGVIAQTGGPRQATLHWAPGKYIAIGIQSNASPTPDRLNFSPGFDTNPGCGPNPAAKPDIPVVWGKYLVSGQS